MTSTHTCEEIVVSSDILADFTTLSTNTLALLVKYNCGTAQTLEIVFNDIVDGSFSFGPSDIGQTDTFSDGVYSLTLVSTEEDSSYAQEFNCIYMDCITSCKIVNATESIKSKYKIANFTDFNRITDPLLKKEVFNIMYMLQLHTALQFVGSCTACTCDNGCELWCTLSKLLGEDGCYSC